MATKKKSAPKKKHYNRPNAKPAAPATPKLLLFTGAKVGSIVSVTYDPELSKAHNKKAAAAIEFGDQVGTIRQITPEGMITIHLCYEDSPAEDVNIDLHTGIDQSYDVVVSDIRKSKVTAKQLQQWEAANTEASGGASEEDNEEGEDEEEGDESSEGEIKYGL